MNHFELNTPVLFLIFNRPDTEQLTFNEIRKVKPKQLFVAADGPRTNKIGEKEKCKQARKIIDQVDWVCEVKTLCRDSNLGCKMAVSSAIDWLFEHVDMGIILEDDVVPSKTFFRYCQELLLEYKDDERIGMISGNNHIGFSQGSDSYLFSLNKDIWGWATWRRAWKHYDGDMKWVNTQYRNLILSNMAYTKKSQKFWERKIPILLDQRLDTWDWPWYFSLAKQNQLCIFPRKNLVSNIGFGQEATHTGGPPRCSFVQKNDLKFPLKHPEWVVPNHHFDKQLEKYKFLDPPLWKKLIPRIIKKHLKKLIRYQW